MRPGEKVFTDPGPDWGVRVIQPAAALEYYRKVLSYGPIAYWPIWDPFGDPTAKELVNSPAQDGAHTAVTLGQPGIGDGRTSGWYDGVTGGGISYTNVWSPAFQAAFNGSEGTMIIWPQMNDAGVWVDGISRYILRIEVDVNNYTNIAKTAAPNSLFFRYRAGAVSEDITDGGHAEIGFLPLALTWSRSAGPTGEVRAFAGGIQVGLTQDTLGDWVGNISLAVIGARSLVPISVHHGWLAHAAVFDYAMPPAGILDLATV